jgi:hypothetical protein
MLRLRLAALAGALLAARLARRLRPAGPAPADTAPSDTTRPPTAFPYGLAAALLLASLVVALAALGWRSWQSEAQAAAVATALTRGDPSRAPALITK